MTQKNNEILKKQGLAALAAGLCLAGVFLTNAYADEAPVAQQKAADETVVVRPDRSQCDRASRDRPVERVCAPFGG